MHHGFDERPGPLEQVKELASGRGLGFMPFRSTASSSWRGDVAQTSRRRSINPAGQRPFPRYDGETESLQLGQVGFQSQFTRATYRFRRGPLPRTNYRFHDLLLTGSKFGTRSIRP